MDRGGVDSRRAVWALLLMILYRRNCHRGQFLVEGRGQEMSSGGRIVGGQNASRFEFPSVARILSAGGTMHYCGAAVINRDWLVTAGHCLIDEKNQALLPLNTFVIQLGNIYNEKFLGEQRVNVTRIIVHERFNWSYRTVFYDDIAVVRVYPEIRFGKYIQPVNVPACREEYKPQDGDEVWTVGWGQNLTEEQPPPPGEDLPYPVLPNTLQKLKVQVISNQECRDAKPEHGKVVPDTTLCIKNLPESGPCFKDSGSPLYLKRGITLTQIGIVAAKGPGNCEGGYAFYTKISYFTGWIFRRIAGCGNFRSTSYPQRVSGG